jgi:hypothetical protein
MAKRVHGIWSHRGDRTGRGQAGNGRFCWVFSGRSAVDRPGRR